MAMKLLERIRIVMIVIFGMMALGLLTWGIGKIYLELVGQPRGTNVSATQKVHQQEGNTSNEDVLNLPDLTFWTCQVGVFQNENNAVSSREKLRSQGVNAEVILSNPWIVGVGFGHSAEVLKGLRTNLTEKGIVTIPKQITLSKRTFRVTGNGVQLTRDLLTQANALLKGGVTAEILSQEKQLWETQAGDHPPKELEALHSVFTQLREKTAPEEQNLLGLALFSGSQRVINTFSRK